MPTYGANSYLLSGLPRADRIPVVLCYRRSMIALNTQFYPDSLNATNLVKHGWYRVDAC